MTFVVLFSNLANIMFFKKCIIIEYSFGRFLSEGFYKSQDFKFVKFSSPYLNFLLSYTFQEKIYRKTLWILCNISYHISNNILCNILIIHYFCFFYYFVLISSVRIFLFVWKSRVIFEQYRSITCREDFFTVLVRTRPMALLRELTAADGGC